MGWLLRLKPALAEKFAFVQPDQTRPCYPTTVTQLIIKIGQIGTQYCDYKKKKPKFNNIMIQKYVIIGITTQQRFLEEIFVAAIYKDGF